MKTIAICNHKGGVGKTALSMAIAEGLHRKGKRTLLVDLDQQMNATQQAKIDTTDEVTVYDLLTSFDYTAKDGIKHFDGGDIIPGDVLVSNVESDMAKLDTRLTMLADAMEGIDDERIYRACGWKNLRVTYAAFEDGGAFWKQTIYSPREKSKLIATKSDRPAEIYGGYSSQTFANFFVYEVMKKKVKQLRFGAVPAAIASKSDPDTYNAMLEMYARGLAKTAKEKFVRIVRARVLKNTMIELYGERFRIAGEKQVYPVRQMPLAIDEVYLLKGVETIAAAGNAGASAKIDFEKAAESLVGFWDLLLEKLPVNYPKLTVQLKLGLLKHPKDILAATSESEFPAIVYKIAEAEIQVMEQASGLRNMSDTKILGGNTFGGSLVFTFNKVLNDPKSKACFIDTTPAGLYEVKTKIW